MAEARGVERKDVPNANGVSQNADAHGHASNFVGARKIPSLRNFYKIVQKMDLFCTFPFEMKKKRGIFPDFHEKRFKKRG